MSGLFPSPQGVIYSATKAFLNTFSEGLDLELRDTDVKVQALCPGLTRTEFHNHPDFENFKLKFPKEMWMTPEQVVEQSLEALIQNEVIFIPGVRNQASIATLTHPKYGKKVREKFLKNQIIPRK